MDSFSLAWSKSKAFPTRLSIDGDVFNIDSSHRTILKIIKILNDDAVMHVQAIIFALKWFYMGNIPSNQQNALAELITFINGYNRKDDNAPPNRKQFDYEFDAIEIYISFLQDYKIDLAEGNLHWYKFCMLLANVSEHSALSQKIRLRFYDTSKLKGKDKADIERAKKTVQFPVKYSKEELLHMNKILEAFGQC
jgi:hypothetical protein